MLEKGVRNRGMFVGKAPFLFLVDFRCFGPGYLRILQKAAFRGRVVVFVTIKGAHGRVRR